MNVILVLLLSALMMKSSLGCSPSPPVVRKPSSQENPPAPPNATASSCGHSVYYNAGESLGAGIVGGLDAKKNEFPWQVRLRIVSGTESFMCGATIICQNWIITAAHCAKAASGESSIMAILGDHDRSITDSGEISVGISKISIHPDFNQASANPNDYDIALLKLQEPLTFSQSIQPICLPESCEASACQTDSPAWITGWGTDSAESTSGLNILQKAWIPVITNSKCSTAYSAVDTTITDRMICAGFDEGGVDTCRGDSGGALICNKAGFWELGGVTSFGQGCGDKGFYGVYAKVCLFLDWIQTTAV